MQPGLLAPSTLLHQRYCIEKQVGTGGFGAVYKARDTLFSHRLVAIKEMNQSGLSPRELAEASAAFQHEALFLAGLAHPHLPRIHDQFAEHGRSYMVMDFIDGYTLEEYLEKIAPRLPLEEVLDIGLQLCSALDYLHTRQPSLILPLLARISPYSSGTASRHAISSPIHNIAKEGPREVCKV
jgi:serine/threonine protein kinase